MNVLFFFTGLLITLITIYDLIFTILAPRGAGFIADYTARGIWRVSLKLCNRDGRKPFLKFVGPVLLLIIVLVWIHLLWLGNTLIVYSDAEALWSAADSKYVTSFMEKLYFTAYVLSSMGNGDYTPSTDWWLFYTGFISYTGVVMISLAISFLIPIIEAITLKRQISIIIDNLGKSPRAILENYKHDRFEKLITKFNDLEPQLIRLAQSHLAYPIIHYFHSENLYESLPVQMVKLDETLSILKYNVEKDKVSDVQTLDRVYRSMTYYISTLAFAFIKPSDDEPEKPDTAYLNNLKNPSLGNVRMANHQLSSRRKLLLGYLQNDGWEWNILYGEHDTIDVF